MKSVFFEKPKLSLVDTVRVPNTLTRKSGMHIFPVIDYVCNSHIAIAKKHCTTISKELVQEGITEDRAKIVNEQIIKMVEEIPKDMTNIITPHKVVMDGFAKITYVVFDAGSFLLSFDIRYYLYITRKLNLSIYNRKSNESYTGKGSVKPYPIRLSGMSKDIVGLIMPAKVNLLASEELCDIGYN